MSVKRYLTVRVSSIKTLRTRTPSSRAGPRARVTLIRRQTRLDRSRKKPKKYLYFVANSIASRRAQDAITSALQYFVFFGARSRSRPAARDPPPVRLQFFSLVRSGRSRAAVHHGGHAVPRQVRATPGPSPQPQYPRLVVPGRTILPSLGSPPTRTTQDE